MSYKHLLAFRQSVEQNKPESSAIVHHFFMPGVASPLECPTCALIGSVSNLGLMGYILEDLNWTPEAPSSIPRFRVYLTAECPTCNNSKVAKFELPLDDIEMLELLGIAAKAEALPPTQ